MVAVDSKEGCMIYIDMSAKDKPSLRDTFMLAMQLTYGQNPCKLFVALFDKDGRRNTILEDQIYNKLQRLPYDIDEGLKSNSSTIKSCLSTFSLVEHLASEYEGLDAKFIAHEYSVHYDRVIEVADSGFGISSPDEEINIRPNSTMYIIQTDASEKDFPAFAYALTMHMMIAEKKKDAAA